jgi:hypothetical protein
MANRPVQLGQIITVHKGTRGEKPEKFQAEVIGTKSGKNRVTYYLGKVIGKDILCLILPVKSVMELEIECPFFSATFVPYGEGKFVPDLKAAASQLNFFL